MNEKELIKISIIVGIYNILVIACFTMLSIVFEKWWIIFFSLIFYKSNWNFNTITENKE